MRKKSNEKICEHILKGSEVDEEICEFNDVHNPNVPAQWWFQESEEGLVLFIVFFTLACRWNRCTVCNLSSKSSMCYVDYRSLINQVDWIFSHPKIILKKKEIKLC